MEALEALEEWGLALLEFYSKPLRRFLGTYSGCRDVGGAPSNEPQHVQSALVDAEEAVQDRLSCFSWLCPCGSNDGRVGVLERVPCQREASCL